jgi:hypothetical protein
MKIRRVAAELFYTDGRKDRHDEANSGLIATLRTLLITEELHKDLFTIGLTILDV